MNADDQPSLSITSRPEPAGFQAASCAVWLAGAVPLSLAIAWLAVLIEPYFAPLVVFPVLVGLSLGTALAGWMRLCRLGHRKSVLLGVLAAAVTLVWGQHYFAYRQTLDQVDERLAVVLQAQLERGDLNNLSLPTPAESLPGYLRQAAEEGRPLAGHVVRGAGVWLWWGLDAVLSLAGAVVPVWFALKRPYCPRCRTWYRVVRAGLLEHGTACEIAGRLELPQAPSGAAKYRLLSCRAGCATSAFELSWDESSAGEHCAFLDAPRREEVTTILDRAIRNRAILDRAISQPSAGLSKNT